MERERMLWVNADRTVMVDTFNDGDTLNVATRENESLTWGPPVECVPEKHVKHPGESGPKERRIIDMDTKGIEIIEQIATDLKISFSDTIERLCKLGLLEHIQSGVTIRIIEL